MPRENKTIYLILGLLAHKSMSGYDIKKRNDEFLKYFWKIGYGQLYPSLKTLEKQGLVKKEPNEGKVSRGYKKYSITPEGLSSLSDWLIKSIETNATSNEYLLKLFFSAHIPIENVIKSMKKFREENEKNLEIAKYYEERLLSTLDEIDHQYYLLVARYGIKDFTKNIEWADETLITLERMKKNRKRKKTKST
jgi:DNA-binding PadR family transcriptional regulator